MNIHVDSRIDDLERRQKLYRGEIFIQTPRPSAIRLCQLAKVMIEEAFYPHDPLALHEKVPVERCVEILATLKPRFIHHPKSKQCIQGMLAEAGCDLEKTYFDVPRLRTAFPSDYLKSGIAYAFHPHRDTWYSAPFCQINWWMPVYPLNSDNCMSFHTHHWDNPVRNSSNTYDYQKWNQESRHNAAQHVKTDTRVQPKPEGPVNIDPQVRLVCDVGGPFLFSAAHLHSTVPNTSPHVRYSIDFRTVHLDDASNGVGARNIDSACTGTTMNDYIRGSDLGRIPAEIVARYEEGSLAESN